MKQDDAVESTIMTPSRRDGPDNAVAASFPGQALERAMQGMERTPLFITTALAHLRDGRSGMVETGSLWCFQCIISYIAASFVFNVIRLCLILTFGLVL